LVPCFTGYKGVVLDRQIFNDEVIFDRFIFSDVEIAIVSPKNFLNLKF